MDVDNITFKQWESTDRTQLVTQNLTVTEFVEELMDKLQVLKLHQFINNQQTKYFYKVKESLPIGNVLVVGDFSENYSFIYQDAVQGVHWSNTSCTLHPWMCYFKGEDSKLKTYSLLFISDSVTHNTVAVDAFKKRLILLLKERLSQDGILLTEVQYFSDGCSKQYKNKKTS